jgi:hypothetical protein
VSQRRLDDGPGRRLDRVGDGGELRGRAIEPALLTLPGLKGQCIRSAVSPGTMVGEVAPTRAWYVPTSMKKLRIPLILLVALILPVKGAMAAAGMFCHLGSAQPMSAIVQPHQHHAGAHQNHAEHHAVDGDSQSDAEDDAPLIPASSSCAICSAVCSAPPLPANGIAFHVPAASGAERFPALSPPRLSAVQSGLERPPRTI